VNLEATPTPAGETVYVDRGLGERGSKGPFYVAFVSPDADERWGYLCSNCDSLDTAMDTMGRIECNVCANVRKPDEWDAAHE
jgi:hypothetical protein